MRDRSHRKSKTVVELTPFQWAFERATMTLSGVIVGMSTVIICVAWAPSTVLRF